MRRSAGRIVAITVVGMLTACTSAPAGSPSGPSSGTASAATERLTDYLDGMVRARQFRGTVEVRLGEHVLLSRGYDQANVAHDIPNEPATRFRIASLTKQFTALAVLILQEQGKLQVTDLLCTHLPNCPAAWRAITIEHLLTHTAGLFNYTELDAATIERYFAEFGPKPTPEQLIQTFIDRPLDFPPGSKWNYSPSGYILRGHLIQLLSGHTYGQFLKNELLDPLDMSNTAYEPDQQSPNEQATAHDAVGYHSWNAPAATLSDAVSFSGGGMYSTVTDLARWNQFLLTGKPTIVEPETLDIGHHLASLANS